MLDEQAVHCEVHIHQEQKRRSGDCAGKAVELTPRDLLGCRGVDRLRNPEGDPNARQKSAEGIVAPATERRPER
jgi:hypothetical protein